MNWTGILKIIEINHIDANGKIIWQQKNVNNLMHQDGEEFLLRAAFTGGRVSTIIPDNYYLGLDNRSAIALDNQITDLIGEPTLNGYERQGVSSSGDFSINFEENHFIATSPIVAFRATSGDWGPVSNLFLTDQEDDSGYLISTAVLSSPITLSAGETVTMRIGMQLKGCS